MYMLMKPSYHQDNESVSHSQKFPHASFSPPTPNPSLFTLPFPSNHWPAFCHYRWVCISHSLIQMESYSMNSFFVWLLSLSIISLGFIHITGIDGSLLLLRSVPLYWIYPNLSLHSPVSGHWAILIASLGLLRIKLLWTFTYKSLY